MGVFVMRDTVTVMCKDWAGGSYRDIPKGAPFLQVSVNPHNGMLVISFENSAAGDKMITDFLGQMHEYMAWIADTRETRESWRDYVAYLRGELLLEDMEPCPHCGVVPIIKEVSIPHEYGDGGLLRYMVVDDNHAMPVKYGPFETKGQAVDAWNDYVKFGDDD